MSQPDWQFITNLGDRHPIDHVGYFVFVDKTGKYDPEAELLISPDDDDGVWMIYRFTLEPCTWINGVLSDNKFHPDHRAWFADSIGAISNSCGISLATLIDMLVNGNVENRALAWRAIGDYHGFENLDSYPLTYKGPKGRKELETRYADIL